MEDSAVFGGSTAPPLWQPAAARSVMLSENERRQTGSEHGSTLQETPAVVLLTAAQMTRTVA